MPLSRIATAEAVIHGVLKLVFADGYEGVVDLRPMIAQGRISSGSKSRKTSRKFSSRTMVTTSFGSTTKVGRSTSVLTAFGATPKNKPNFTS